MNQDKNINCLNPWDPQSKRQYGIDGVYCALNAGHGGGGQAHGICYCIEGNTVDRDSRKNGCGYCADVSPTLNTQDRHAVVFRKVCKHCADGCGERWQEDPVCGTLNGFEFHSPVRTPEIVCIEGNGSRMSHKGPGYQVSDQMYTLNTVEQHAVCYAVDVRHLRIDGTMSGTLQAKNTGGHSLNYINPVIYEQDE